MTPEQLLTWLGIVTAVGGAAMTYGLLRGRVDEQERRIEALEERTKETDNVLHAAAASLPQNQGDVTSVWDTPRALTNGKFVVSAFSEGGQEWGDDWILPETEES
jgi:hypothetical protein